MRGETDTVHGRITRLELTPAEMTALVIATALVGVLLFSQTPMLHDSVHDFRHAAGITCH